MVSFSHRPSMFAEVYTRILCFLEVARYTKISVADYNVISRNLLMTGSELVRNEVGEHEVGVWMYKSSRTRDNGMARGSVEACWAKRQNSEVTVIPKRNMTRQVRDPGANRLVLLPRSDVSRLWEHISDPLLFYSLELSYSNCFHRSQHSQKVRSSRRPRWFVSAALVGRWRKGERAERTGKGRVWARGTFQGASRAMKMIDLRKAKAK
jgi:hypothetical protein